MSKNYAKLGGYYENGFLSVTRTSGTIDRIPVALSDQTPGWVTIEGDIYTYNDSHRHLILCVYPYEVTPEDPHMDTNQIQLEGYICTQPQLRTTLSGRIICSFMCAVPRDGDPGSDYIPVIAWGHTAEHIATMSIGTEISMEGRLQSREYTKDNQIHITYEVSITALET